MQLEVTLEVGEGKRAKVNGAALRAAEQLRSEVATLVFTPDRLAVVKGGPAVRRAYFDRVLGRLAPARASLAVEYAAAVAQRNAALRRAAGGYSSRDAIAPWTEQVATLGRQLVEARTEVVAWLAALFAQRAEELGLPAARMTYEGEPPTVETLEARLDRDLERGTTGLGPHLDDIVLTSGPRDLRSFGSQGEQRLTVLALLLAEASLIAERRGFAAAAPARRRSLRARPGPPAGACRACARVRPDAHHRDGGIRPARRSGAAARGRLGRGTGRLMERIGEGVARQLRRFGPASGMAPVVEQWVGAVGPEIARNAWPARLARDGTLHVHTQDSIWAFELTTRAEEIRGRLGDSAPRRLAFAPGPLPEPAEDVPEAVRKPPPPPSPEHVAKAESLTREIRDEELRKVVAKAAAASLSRGDNDRSFC